VRVEVVKLPNQRTHHQVVGEDECQYVAYQKERSPQTAHKCEHVHQICDLSSVLGVGDVFLEPVFEPDAGLLDETPGTGVAIGALVKRSL
jgi:hypothetical protein